MTTLAYLTVGGTFNLATVPQTKIQYFTEKKNVHNDITKFVNSDTFHCGHI